VNVQQFSWTVGKLVNCLAFQDLGQFTHTANGTVILVRSRRNAWQSNADLFATHGINRILGDVIKTFKEKISSETGGFGLVGYGGMDGEMKRQ
jgi:hypothetical protein